MGVPQEFGDALAGGLAGYQGHIVVVNATSVAVRSMTRLGSFSLGIMRRMDGGKDERPGEEPAQDPARMMKMVDWMEKLGRALPVGPLRDMRNFFWISRYWLYGTAQNLENMLHLIGREYFGCNDFPQPQPPAVIKDCSIMDPASGRIFKSMREFYRAFPPAPDKPGLGLFFRTKTYPLDTHPLIGTVMARFSESFNVIPIGLDSTVARDFKMLRSLLMPQGKPLVDILINPEPFRLAQGPMGGDAPQGENFLRDLNVPVLHPFFLNKRTVQQWMADDKGADVGEFLISIFLPELDGCVEMYPAGAVGSPQDQTPELAPVEERVERLAQRALRWSRLRRKKNHEKKLAVIFYNYPPGEATVGGSAFLDTFASLAAMLGKLSSAGYDAEPMSAEMLRQAFIGGGRINNPAWHTRSGSACPVVDKKAYQSLTSDMPGHTCVEEIWGVFPGSVMSAGETVLIPGIINGNIFIGLQPARGVCENSGSTYHDKHMPPHHQYISFYRWLEHEFQADAVVHVGTHGTLEFLPGKEKALSGECFPDTLIGSLPHVYVYYSGNPAEAMIAKRRAHAVLIGHLPPPFRQGELYDDLQALKLLLDEHEEARNLNPGRCQTILKDIRKRVGALGWEWRGLDDLHRQLHEMKTALIPSRLHTLGSGFSEDEIAGYLAGFLRCSGAEGGVLYTMLARQQCLDWGKISSEPHLHSAQRDQVDHLARQWIFDHIIKGTPVVNFKDETRDAIRTIISRGESIAKALMHNSELDEIVRALNGEFIPPGLSGDLFRSPEILPTGRNLVQFDPRLVPSPSAMEHGAHIAAKTLEQYVQAHGRYPRSIAVILWGLETSQTQGETVGQILAYLGVCAVRAGGQWESHLEIIPLAELGRPRVDVTVQICGFFRDMFPNTLALLQNAFSLVGFASEPDEMNFVRANSRRLFGALQAQGMQEADAREFALARVFGPASSEYGTSLEQIVKNRAWQSESDLVTAYIESLKHAYTPRHYGVEMGDLLTENLSRVEVVSQVRSSRDYEITDLDHYYEFFGGLARSVEQASGKKAMLLISDSHEGRARTEDVRDSIRRGVCTRLTNPAWLEGMLSHSHHGGQEVAKRMENLIGLAATTGAVDPATFDRVNSRLVFDDAMRCRIRDNNPYALLDIIKRLWEARSRGYWSPDEATLERLQQIYMDAEAYVEGARQ
jgi:cobaltochelatase CobN